MRRSILAFDALSESSNASVGAMRVDGVDIVKASMRVMVSGMPNKRGGFLLATLRTRNAFAAIDVAIRLLHAPIKDDAARTRLSAGIAQLDQASERVQLARATAGAPPQGTRRAGFGLVQC